MLNVLLSTYYTRKLITGDAINYWLVLGREM